MRHKSFAAVFALAALLAASTAWATGNVLLPPLNNDSSTPAPSLGIAAPPAPADQSPAPAVPPPLPPAAMTPTPPTAAPTQPSAPPDIKNVISTLDPAIAAKLPRGAIPTTIIHQPDVSGFLAQAGKDLPNSLTIAIGGNSIFGAKDIQQIGKKLGLSGSQITSNCLLTMQGLMQTDKGSYVIDGGASPQATVRYTGMIKNYLMSGVALCTATNLPNGSGFLTESGGRYMVALQQITCPAPTRQVGTLTITYDGSGASKCFYQ